MRQFVSEVPDKVYQQIKEFGNTPVLELEENKYITDVFGGRVKRLD
jgi:hypothetical protein